MPTNQVFVPKAADFASLIEVKGDMQALCNLPCQQVCNSCSCKAAEDGKPEESAEYRFAE